MMDIATIKRLNAEAAGEADHDRVEPLVVTERNIREMPPFPFPYIGDYAPPGWRETNEYFVDASGLGDEAEPALTAGQLIKELKVGRGYAIVSQGQFQVYVAEYEWIGSPY